MAMANKGCGCCNQTPGPITVVPPGCSCTAVPASLAVSLNASVYGSNFTPLVNYPEITANDVYKDTPLTWSTAGFNDRPANRWYSGLFTSMESQFQGGGKGRGGWVLVYFDAFWSFRCVATTWRLTYHDTRFGPGVNGDIELWQWTVSGQSSGINPCSPFHMSCGRGPNSSSSCTTAFDIH